MSAKKSLLKALRSEFDDSRELALFREPSAKRIQRTEPGVARDRLHSSLAERDEEGTEIGSGDQGTRTARERRDSALGVAKRFPGGLIQNQSLG